MNFETRTQKRSLGISSSPKKVEEQKVTKRKLHGQENEETVENAQRRIKELVQQRKKLIFELKKISCKNKQITKVLALREQELKKTKIEMESSLCILCTSGPSTVALVPCGHVCLGLCCTDIYFSSQSECPICRRFVETYVRLYFS